MIPLALGPTMLLPLAYRPFLDPLDLHALWWWTLIPLVVGISIAYKAVRVRTFEGYWRQVTLMSVQVLGAMVALAAGVFLLVEVLGPLLGGE